MRGHIRRRGEHSFEYIVDIGMASAQRCQACGRRFWVERKPKECCPKCGGELAETEERRRAIKGGFATRKECQAALTKVLAAVEARRPSRRPPGSRSRPSCSSEWLPAVKGSLRPTTYACYAMLAREHIIPRLGALQLQKLTAGCDQRPLRPPARGGPRPWRAASQPPRCAACTPSCTGPVTTPCAGARLTVNPVAAADPPKASAEHHDRLPVWSAEQLAAFLAHVADDRLFALWRLLAMTGMRRGEALGLQWEDLDMEAGAADHPPRLDPGQRRRPDERAQDQPRPAHDRPGSRDPGGPARPTPPARPTSSPTGEEAWTESGFVFTRPDGRPLVPWAVSKAFRDHAQGGLLPPIPLHGLRHTYATLALASGVNPRIVSGRLGHATVALTLDVYSHVLPQQDRQAAEAIAALLL